MNVIAFGATSTIAEHVLRQLCATQNCRLLLVGRDAQRLATVAADLTARGSLVDAPCIADLGDPQTIPALAEHCLAMLAPDVVLIAQGLLPDPTTVNADSLQTQQALMVNGNASVVLLQTLVSALRDRAAHIVVISSVAGDRGRASNYCYGAAKALVSTYTEGLIDALAQAPLAVHLVKPGMVRSRMTAHLPRSPLMAEPERVAADIERALRGSGGIVYSPWYWRPVMWVLRLLPPFIFRRLPI